LLAFFEPAHARALSWVRALEGHSLLQGDEAVSERARQCRAALNLFLRLYRIDERLAGTVPAFQHPDALLDWFTAKRQHLLELELSHAHHDLQVCAEGEDELQEKGQNYLFGGPDELRPTAGSLKGRVLSRLCQLDEMLAIFVRAMPEDFGRGARSVRGFL